MRVSNSSIQTFKRCPRMYQLHYIYGFTPIEKSDAIETGLSYHEAVEGLIRGEDLSEWSYPWTPAKTAAMIGAFRKYALPFIVVRDEYVPEQWFEYKTKGGNRIVGRYDGLGQCSVLEHKTTGQSLDANYWANVWDDEQLLTYMLASGKNHALYTACSKPRIRQSIHETDEAFAERCRVWYDTDTEQKIAVSEIVHTAQEIAEHEQNIDAMCKTIKHCTNFYRNRAFCRYYGRVCEYAPICNHCDPDAQYPGFTKEGE